MPVQRWLRFQRTGLYLYFFLAVLLLVYSLGFLTNVYLFYAYGNKELSNFYREMQGVNNIFLREAILVVIFGVLLFALELGRHAAGAITLGITILVSLGSAALTVFSFLALLSVKNQYMVLDLSSLDRYIQRGTISYSFSTLTYDMGLVLCILFLGASLLTGIIVTCNACTVKEGTP